MKFNQKISEELFFKSYAINSEKSVEEVLKAVSKEIASAEETKKKKIYYEKIFYEYLESGKLIPGGRILANAKSYSKMNNYSNCFVIEVKDSLENIYDSIKEAALIGKQGGGIGFNLSSLRPKNDSLSVGGTASGPISFMKVFNESGKIIRIGGQRRSALIVILNIDHPDIEEFVVCKQGDETKALTQMNISVGITNKFMKAVKQDLNWDLKFKNKVYKTVKAKYLYDLLCKNAFEHNEPGILNLDEINYNNNVSYLEEIKSTNPCIPEFSILKTKEGLKQLKDIKIGDEIWSKSGWTKILNKWSNGIKDVYRWESTSGCLFATKKHKIVDKGKKVKLENAKSIDILLGQSNFLEDDDIDLDNKLIMDGLMIGDGSRCINKNKNYDVYLTIGKKDQDYFNSEIKDLIISLTYPSDYINGSYRVITSITKEELPRIKDRDIPNRFLHSDEKTIRSFLRGLYTANGSICGKRVTYKTINKQIINKMQIMLSSVGIQSYYTTNKSKKVIFSNGEYQCKESYDLNIGKDRNKFYNLIGFIQKYKMKKLALIINNIKKTKLRKDNVIIKNCVLKEKLEVFDITVDNKSHTFWCNGFNISNCGEVPLLSYEACNLGSINLTKFVNNPFTDNAFFDFNEFIKTVKIGIRFLDNVIDKTEMPLEKINKKVKNFRRCGLGITGLGGMFAMMKTRYGSQVSKKLCHSLGILLRDVSYKTSALLAKEKGKFKYCDKKKIINSNFIQKLPEDIKNLIKKNGLRNVACNTIAPTGTTSLTLGQNCSSGIEPIVALEYNRTIRIDNENNTKIEKIYDYTWLLYQNIIKKDKPDYFITLKDIDAKEAIDIQSILQKYIDNSISKTHNLKKGTSYSEYKDLFMYAYDNKLKGFTTFNPEGSMKGILDYSESNSKIENKGITRHDAPKRPKKLDCDIFRIKVKDSEYTIIVGRYYDGSVYEVFVDKNHVDITKHKNGIIQKVKKNHYRLLDINNEILIDNIGKEFDDTLSALARLISMSLRHGVSLEFLVNQLSKSNEFISFDKAIARVLKKYIKNGEKVKHSSSCPECGNHELVYIEGCKTCLSCGYGACG